VNLLLDTHIWLRALLEPERLSPHVTIAASDARPWLSPLSVWESTARRWDRIRIAQPAATTQRTARQRNVVVNWTEG